jgi:hypothetical protein
MGYQLEGQLLEVCNCDVLCPCWVGEDPDNGTCDTIVAYHVDSGKVDNVDVSGRTLAVLAHVPGNIFAGNWKVAVVVDDGATTEQKEALLAVWTGKHGGPVADLAKLVGEVVAVETAPITFTIVEGAGTLKIGSLAECEMAPFHGPTGVTTTLNESAFTTIPGAPAWVGKASVYKRNTSQFGLADIDLSGHNAIQGTFHFSV